MSKAELIEMTKDSIAHAKAGTISQTPDVYQVPATNYYDEAKWQLEMKRIFRRMPLMLAITPELPNPGDYKSMNAAGMPVLITRDKEGEARAFVNMCSHRGSVIVPEGHGNSGRFTCPYHAWTYSPDGRLVGILAREDFGEIDMSCHGLTELPLLDRAGMIWVTLNPKSTLDTETFLSGYDQLLAHFGFEDWHMFAQRTLKGPNWKIAYDGYLDFYHLPVLHKDTFGTQMSNQALYYAWGPHQRVSAPDARMLELEGNPEEQWPPEALMGGVWTIFPHISIASFDGGGGRGVMISQLFPGSTPLESFTVQNYVLEKEPNEEQSKSATEQFEFLKYVVEQEDYATGLRQQGALITGAKDHVLFGRNEGGGQRFHQWLEKLLETEDEDLNALFQAGI